MKRFPILLLFFITAFCVSCNRNNDIIIAKDGTKSKKVVMEQNSDKTAKVVYYYKLDKDGNITQEVTREEHFYPEGKKYVEGDINKGKRNGEWFAYHKDGSIQTSAFYIDGVNDGEYKVFRENGKPLYTGQYKMGVYVGAWKEYDNEGNVIKWKEYDNEGNVVKAMGY